MTLWVPVLAAAALAFGTKYLGYVVPERWLAGRRMRRITGLLPVALLTALVVVQAFLGPTGALVLDARAAAVAVAVGGVAAAGAVHRRRRARGRDGRWTSGVGLGLTGQPMPR